MDMRLVLLAIIVLAVAGCVRTNSELLDARTAMITAKGTAFDEQSDVIRVTLREAAKITKEHGYQYFQVVDSKDATRRSYVQTDSSSYTTGTFTAQSFGSGYGSTTTGMYSESTVTDPGDTYELIKPGAVVIVRFLETDNLDKDAHGVWDADSILALANED